MAQIIHRKKLFGGRDARELHHKLAWGSARCTGCGAAPAIRIQSFLCLSDMDPAVREATKIHIALGEVHTVQTTSGPAVRTGEIFACHACKGEAERTAAQGPSYAMIAIDRGPGEDKIQISVI